MKLVILSSANSIHTIQWAKYLANLGIDVHVVSQHPASQDFPQHIPVHILPFKGFLGYFLNSFALKKLVKLINPDIVNVHYASGYGTTARLTNFHPYVLSVWGSDVFEFPFRSPLHRYLLKRNLAVADTIASTSIAMSNQTQQFLIQNRNIPITPFGVDFSKFNKNKIKNTDQDVITIGTVKTLKHVYGIDILIHALAKVYQLLKQQNCEFIEKIKFRIVGGGPDLQSLQQLACDLGIKHLTTFVGRVDHQDVPEELGKLDIYVALSRQESFGVAVLEAQAMGLPVVVSNVGGLPEVVQSGKTGYIVETENPDQAAEMIVKLILDQNLRDEFAINAENFSRQNFSWEACAQNMQKVYQETLVNFKNRV
ncbi:glycosyltransferase [Acinetobacter calcoaceticus]|uniref:Glycosyltransferase involved in cell wall biosynthesis n=1 Tax=Acinetobacter calcoaceticus TaxID=471 RepID=A0ABD5AR10_ACICA|nr:glycosyltransferase [Acinetobacter calcoaceticus]MDP9804989.1 glycosyltransferase involved in cell wall biosynthesis [Acinetobacter calcoaceticus]